MSGCCRPSADMLAVRPAMLRAMATTVRMRKKGKTGRGNTVLPVTFSMESSL
jgi:hypothetical protein